MNQNYELTFQDYLIIIRIHYKKILALTLIGLLLGLYITYNIPPEYRATATIEIREKPGASMIMDLSGNRSQNILINEIEVIRSRALAKEVVKNLWNSDRRNNLHIFGTKTFYPKGQRVRNIVKEIFTLGLYDPSMNIAKKYDEPYTNAIGDRFSGAIISGMSVTNKRNTNILAITFSSKNADEARRLSNKIAETYVRYDGERSKRNAIKSKEFLDSLVNEQQSKIEEKENRIRDFKLLNNMYSLDGDASSIIDQMNNYEGELYNIIAEINIRKEKAEILNSRLTKEEKNLKEKLSNDINSQLISLRIEIGTIESQVVQNTSVYGSNHGAVIELNEKLNSLKGELNKKVSELIAQGITVQDPLQERQNTIEELLNLDSEIIGFELRKTEINKMLNVFNSKLNQLPAKQMELARLNRDIDVLNNNYSYLRQKLEEAKLNIAVKVGNSNILDSARMPTSPIGPNHQRNILLGIFLGLVSGLVFSFIIEFLDNTMKTIDEIEKYDLNVLGIIPAITTGESHDNQSSKFWNNYKKSDRANNKGIKRRLMTREDPKSPVSEAYRSLRTNFLYSTDREVKSILVSSAGPGEGKTTTVANLAITYANLGKKTLLVDTDLRRPVVHKVFDLEREPGVTNYLSSQTDNYKELIKKTDIENLSVVTSGVIPPNPSEMLGSKRMVQLAKLLEQDWDMVLFDSPPLVAVTDANMVSKEIDQIVLVVKVGQTDKKAFHHTINNLKTINAPLGGIIMNAVTNKSSYGSYYYYYYHQYYNYYGSNQDSA